MISTKLKSALLLCGAAVLCNGSASADCAGKADDVYQEDTTRVIGIKETNIVNNNAAYLEVKGKTDPVSKQRYWYICSPSSTIATEDHIGAVKTRRDQWKACYPNGPAAPGQDSYLNLCP